MYMLSNVQVFICGRYIHAALADRDILGFFYILYMCMYTFY